MEKVLWVLFSITIFFAPLLILFGLGKLVELLMFGPKIAVGAVKAVLIPGEIETILQRKFSYYQQLNFTDKQKFCERVKQFLRQKEFTGKEGLIISNEMCILIAAAAVQITFGLRNFLFDHFTQIYIYPKSYHNRLTKKQHVGEVNLSGIIIFSWEDFQEGFSVEHDNYNVGLHEMAHALRFDKMQSDEYDTFFAIYVDKWIMNSYAEFQKIKRGDTSYLHQYAGTNINEFFAVCIEYFFETPDKFKEKLPEVYKQLCILLNQDPLQPHDSARSVRSGLLSQHAPEPGELIEKLKKDRSARVLDIIFLVGFVLLTVTIAGKDFWKILLFYGALFGFVSLIYRTTQVVLHGEAIVYRSKSLFSEKIKTCFYSSIVTASFYYVSSKYGSAHLLDLCYADGDEIKYLDKIDLTSYSDIDRTRIADLLKGKNILVKMEDKVY